MEEDHDRARVRARILVRRAALREADEHRDPRAVAGRVRRQARGHEARQVDLGRGRHDPLGQRPSFPVPDVARARCRSRLDADGHVAPVGRRLPRAHLLGIGGQRQVERRMGAGVEHEQPRVAAVVDPDVDPAAGVVEVEGLDVASEGRGYLAEARRGRVAADLPPVETAEVVEPVGDHQEFARLRRVRGGVLDRLADAEERRQRPGRRDVVVELARGGALDLHQQQPQRIAVAQAVGDGPQALVGKDGLPRPAADVVAVDGEAVRRDVVGRVVDRAAIVAREQETGRARAARSARP